MSVYVYRANNNTCRDNKLRFMFCNNCGSMNLDHPRNSESDHRDVLRFDCKSCGSSPYWEWMHTSDAILVTNKNKDEIIREICLQFGKDPDVYSIPLDIEG